MKKKQKRKKKYGTFFRRTFCICLLIACALVGWLVFYQSWKACLEPPSADYFEYCNSFRESVKIEDLLWAADKKDRPVSRVLAVFSRDSAYRDSAWLLYQPETGEYYTNETYALAEVVQNGEKQRYELTDRKIIERLGQTLDPSGYGTLLVYSIYVKDDQFVPGEVYQFPWNLEFYEWYLQREGKKIPGKWIDLSPWTDLPPEGWTKICTAESKEELTVSSSRNSAEQQSEENKTYLKYVNVIGSPAATAADSLLDFINEELPQRYKALQENHAEKLHEAKEMELTKEFLKTMRVETRAELIEKYKAEHNRELRDLPKTLYNSFMSRTTLPYQTYETGVNDVIFRGKTWKLYHFQYIDPVKKYQFLVLQFWPLIVLPVLVLVLAASLLLSAFAYLISSRRYDRKNARRRLADALVHDMQAKQAVRCEDADAFGAEPENPDGSDGCIREPAAHTDVMLAGMLWLTHPESGAAPEMQDTVDLAALLHTAFQHSAEEIAQRGLHLTESGSMEIPGNSAMLTLLAEKLAADTTAHAADNIQITVEAEKNILRISYPYSGELNIKLFRKALRRGDTVGTAFDFVQQAALLHKLRFRIRAKKGVFTAELKR